MFSNYIWDITCLTFYCIVQKDELILTGPRRAFVTPDRLLPDEFEFTLGQKALLTEDSLEEIALQVQPQSELESDSELESEAELDSESEAELEWEAELEFEQEPTFHEKMCQALHLVACKQHADLDPKQNALVPTRLYSLNIAFFDLDQECEYIKIVSSMGFSLPCHYVFQSSSSCPLVGSDIVSVVVCLDLLPAEAIHGPPIRGLPFSQFRHSVGLSNNVVSVKVTESDVGYPIRVFGTVLARDVVDYKCMYLFRLERDDAQLINSPVCIKEKPLIRPHSFLLLTLDYLYIWLSSTINQLWIIKGKLYIKCRRCFLESEPEL